MAVLNAHFDGHVVPFHLTFDKLFPLVSHASELFVAKFDVKNSKIANLNKKYRSAPIIAKLNYVISVGINLLLLYINFIRFIILSSLRHCRIIQYISGNILSILVMHLSLGTAMTITCIFQVSDNTILVVHLRKQ